MKKLFSRFKKGVSIVEVVIAIAVISIISVAAVTTLTYSIKAQNKNLRDFDVATTCDTVIDCYRYENLALLNSIYDCTDNDNVKTIDRGSYTLEIVIDHNTIKLSALDKSGNKIHSTISYTK